MVHNGRLVFGSSSLAVPVHVHVLDVRFLRSEHYNVSLVDNLNHGANGILTSAFKNFMLPFFTVPNELACCRQPHRLRRLRPSSGSAIRSWQLPNRQ